MRAIACSSPPSGRMNSRAGPTRTDSTFSTVRCVAGSKRRISSISSPQKATRRGYSLASGKRSTISPRTATCPLDSTMSTRSYPWRTRRATSASRPIGAPGSSVSNDWRKTVCGVRLR